MMYTPQALPVLLRKTPVPFEDTLLSPHFHLSEFVVSNAAERLGLDNIPPPEIVENLYYLAAQLEKVRQWLGDAPLIISSGYRCPLLNAAVGGARDSDHLKGLAADFIAPRYGTPAAICRALTESDPAVIPYRQVIHEHTWVHLGFARPGGKAKPKREALTLVGPGRYAVGILDAKEGA